MVEICQICELLDLSAAFDTIDHENLFHHLEKYVGISGDASKLIKSYLTLTLTLTLIKIYFDIK